MRRFAHLCVVMIACLLGVIGISAATLAKEAKEAGTAAAHISLAAAYSSSPSVHIGNAERFHSLLPAAVLERQVITEYRQLIAAAAVQKTLLPDNDPCVQRLRAIMHRLIPASFKWNDRAKQWKWEINIVRSPRIDAFALPGGKILFYSGMFDRQLTNSEVAMLLGHEIAHALREHAFGHLDEEQIMPLGAAGELAQLYGPNNLGGQSPGLITQMLMLKYSGDDETEADIIGTDIAARAGYDPRAAIKLWRKLLVWNRITPVDFVESHPLQRSRIRDLQGRLPEMLELYEKARTRRPS